MRYRPWSFFIAAFAICPFVAVLAFSPPAAAKSWKCACTLHVTNPDFKWLTFNHSFDEFDLIGYSGADEKTASEKCNEIVAERTHNFVVGALLTLADGHILSLQKTKWRKQGTNLCKEAEKVGTEKLDGDTHWELTCRAYDSSLGKTASTGGIKVSSGRAEGKEITCGS